MPNVTRREIFAQAARKLRQDHEELATVPHRGLKGQEGEKLVRAFLNAHLPKRFCAGAGFIIDGNDSVSKQTDVVIYDAFNCPIYRASEDAAIIPNDNVAAVVEVKASLDKERLIEAHENISAAKSLAKKKPPEGPFLVQYKTIGCLFAFKSGLTFEKIIQHYESLLRKDGLGHHIDIIMVLDRGVITLIAKIPWERGWGVTLFEGMGGPDAEGSHLGIGLQEIGEDSLDFFLRFLLAHLTFFRDIVPFNWTGPQGQIQGKYLCSFTQEKDPELRKQKLRQYTEEAMKEFRDEPSPEGG